MKFNFHYPPIYENLKRGPATLQPKDIGLIISYSGLGKESECVEAGSGSGFLTVALANICKKVYSYEIREDFLKLTEENLNSLKIKNVILKNKNIFEGIDERDVDAVILDMLNSYLAIGHAFNALKKNGFCIGYLPNIEQAKTFFLTLKKNNFKDIFMIESIVREYEVNELNVRPKHIGLMHTAYLVFGKK